MKSARIRWAIYLLSGLIFGAYYLLHTVFLDIADPRLLAHFAAHKPYQLRILMPLLLAAVERSGFDLARGVQLLSLGSVMALAIAFRFYLREWVGPKAALWALWLWPLLFLFYSHHWCYLYDLPAVAFLTLGLWLLNRQQWNWFGLTLFFATLNRESSVLLVLAFAATYFAPRDPNFWRRLALYSAIWLGIKLGLSLIFASNIGPNIEWHWADNRDFLSSPAAWDWGFRLSLIAFAGLLFGALISWRVLPRLLRVSTLLSLILTAVLLGVGVVSETRLLGEMVPLLLPPLCLGWNQMAIKKRP